MRANRPTNREEYRGQQTHFGKPRCLRLRFLTSCLDVCSAKFAAEFTHSRERDDQTVTLTREHEARFPEEKQLQLCCTCCTTVTTIMNIHINHHSGEPLYRQIVEAIRLRIAAGQAQPGEQLPSIRELAEQLQINTRTIVKAYEELDRTGLVVTQHGRGVFVASQRASLPVRERRKRLRELALKILVEASQIGSPIEEVMEVIQDAAAELEIKQ